MPVHHSPETLQTTPSPTTPATTILLISFQPFFLCLLSFFVLRRFASASVALETEIFWMVDKSDGAASESKVYVVSVVVGFGVDVLPLPLQCRRNESASSTSSAGSWIGGRQTEQRTTLSSETSHSKKAFPHLKSPLGDLAARQDACAGCD